MTNAYNTRAYRVFLAGGVAICWLVCTVALLEKYLSVRKASGLCFLGCVGILGCVAALQRCYKTGRDVNRWAAGAVFTTLILSFVVLYPKSQRHAANKGSDREDALRVELVAVGHHEYPYDARTFLGNPPTPLPGAMLLAAPFFLTGRVAFQNLVWAAIFLAVLLSFFKRRATAVTFFAIFLIAAAQNLNDFDVGGDYITNVMYVAVALFLFDRALGRKDLGWLGAAAIGLLGLALSSRIVYAVALLPLLALAVQRTTLQRALRLTGAAVFVAVAVTLPFFMPHPISRMLTQLGQNADKFQALPLWLPPSSLVVAALVLGSLAFFARMDLARVYGLFGLCSVAMILPPLASVVYAGGSLRHPLPTSLGYLAVSSIFLSLWMFSRLEQIGVAEAQGGAALPMEQAGSAGVL